jgi:hypothetical protein
MSALLCLFLVRLSACFNSRTGGRILIKCSMDIMAFRASRKVIRSNAMESARTCEVGAILRQLRMYLCL